MSPFFSDITKQALRGQMCGDAFGAAFEFNPEAPRLARESMAGKHYLTWQEAGQKPSRARLAGAYTDDTQQALLALILKGRQGVEQSLGMHFLTRCRMMRNSKIQDASFGCHRGTGRNFRDFVTTGKPVTTAGLGAAMRVGPLATLFEDPQEMVGQVLDISAATTDDPVGLAVATRYAFLVWVTAYPDRKNEASRVVWPIAHGITKDIWGATTHAVRVMNSSGGEALVSWARTTGWANRDLKSPADGFGLTGFAWAVVQALKAQSFEEAMINVCSSGGDADTVAAMAGCLAGLKHEPPRWMIEGLYSKAREILQSPESWSVVDEEEITRSEILLRQGAVALKTATSSEMDFLDFVPKEPLQPILFGGKGDLNLYAPFSNFFQASFDLEGLNWLTVEHYFQAKKSDDPEHIRIIRNDSSPAAAKKQGKRCYCRPDWDQIKFEVMLAAVHAKFDQNPHLKALLLSTGDQPLHENRPDPWWGGGPNYPHGKDGLGQALMRVREELRMVAP